MKNRSQWKFLFIFSSLLFCADLPAEEGPFRDWRGAVLITKATLNQFERGEVVGYFPNAALSRDALRRTKGYFAFDTTPENFQASHFPCPIEYSRAEGTYDTAKKQFIETKPEVNVFRVNESQLIAKLNECLPTPLPEGLAFSSPLEKMTELGDKTRLWFLLNATAAKDEGGAPVINPAGAESYSFEWGDRKKLEEEYKKLQGENASRNIYLKNYGVLSLSLKIYRLVPGNDLANPIIGKGLHLIKQRDPKVTKGALMFEKGVNNEPRFLNLSQMKVDTDGTYEVQINAEQFIGEVFGSIFKEENAQYECLVPDEKDTDLVNEYACKNIAGKVEITGALNSSNQRSLKFIVERLPRNGENTDLYRDQYQVELHAEGQRNP